MSTLFSIAAFELKNRLRSISTYAYFLLYGSFAALWMAAAAGAIPGATINFGSDKVLINGPQAIAVAITVLGFLGVTVIAASMGRAIQQDFEYGTFNFFFTAPIRKRDYFFGRFLGAYVQLTFVFLGIAAGILVGSHIPGVDPAMIGPATLEAFVRPYLFYMLPNLLWLGGIFFVAGALSRQMAAVYAGGVAVLVGYLLAVNLLADMDNKNLAAMIDPFGLLTHDVMTRYWSVTEKNTRQIALSGVVLWNREIWGGLGLLAIAFGYRAFRMEAVTDRVTRKQRRAAKAKPAVSAAEPASNQRLPSVTLDHRTGSWLRMLPSMTRLYLRQVVRSPVFLLIIGGCATYILGSASTIGDVYGVSTWPVTWEVLEITSGFFNLFILVVTAIYAGEMVWRERDARMEDIVDAAPHPTWLPFGAKLLTLALMQALLLLVVMICGIAIQLWFHYTKFEIGHYLFDLYAVQLPDYLILAAVALTVHVMVNNKYAAHVIVGVLFLVRLKLPDFGFEDRLYLFGLHPKLRYSDMNGYGHFLPAVRAFQVYWGAGAALLLTLSYRFWVRGRETQWRQRARLVRRRGGPALVTVTAACLGIFAVAGSWIFYNTHVLNPFRNAYQLQAAKAEYEKRYKQFEYAPQPDVTSIDLDVDLYPHRHRADMKGRYALINHADQPISDLYVSLPEFAEIHGIAADIPLTAADAAPELRWRHYRLQRPLQPGETTNFSFDMSYAVKGFTNNGATTMVLDNGTFLNAAFGDQVARLPGLGYDSGIELVSDADRRKFGLAPRERLPDLDDPRAQQQGENWITHYAATVSTDADQTAITSGYLQKDWVQHGADGDRHFFQYAMDGHFQPSIPVLSGHYSVRLDHWSNGRQDVDIEIDYQAGHEYDLDSMIASVKDSLDYYTQHYTPYQFKVLRIIEFPRYEKFAESFPNTVPYAESIGFIARVDPANSKDVDYPYWVTAHEVAHQWWGHQESPSNVQGSLMLVESLAEYSSLMVLRHKYGDAKMHRFLQYELDRYLFGRSTEQKKEQPLLRADGPMYLHYSKGSLALYALQDGIGEDALNQALSAFVRRWQYKSQPYPTTRDLVAEIRKVTPQDKQYLIDDLIENITFFDLRATAAIYKALPDGKFEVTLTATAKKLRADGLGKETEVAMSEPVDIGALDDKKEPILIEKQTVHTGSNEFKFVVDRKPSTAGIDPLNKFIDRLPEDNTIAVKAE